MFNLINGHVSVYNLVVGQTHRQGRIVSDDITCMVYTSLSFFDVWNKNSYLWYNILQQNTFFRM